MHSEEREIESYKEQPKMDFAQPIIHHSARYFRNPKVHSSKHGKQRPANQDVMEMGNHEEGIVYLPVEGNRCKHHSREATDEEDKEEAEDPQHGQLQL